MTSNAGDCFLRMSRKTNDCRVCSKAFNKYLRKPVTCPRCTATVCKSCLTKDIVAEIPKCLQCNYEFDDDFIATHFTMKFLVNHRMNALFQKEEMMLPETKLYASYELKMREVRERMKMIHTQFKVLETQYKTNMKFYKGLLNEWDNKHGMSTATSASATSPASAKVPVELPDIDDIKRLPDIPGATDTLLKYHKLLQDVQENELANEPVVVEDAFMENIDTRIKYSLGEYSKDEFIKLIFNNDKNKNKLKDRYNVFNTLLIEGVSLFEALLECSSMECIASIIVSFDDLLSRKNTALQNAAKKYSCKMPSIAI